MNKATITIAVFIIVLVGGLLLWRAGDLQAPVVGNEEQVVEGENNGNTGGFAPMISEEDLAMHNSADDCWIAYKGTVYDVTDWLSKHPGGSAAIAQYCGTSEEFTKAFEGQHGEKQQNLLPEVGNFVGTLGVIEGAQS
ncbi:MAG: cytochrome b5 domain-containing protein [Patescibacteria group bacterium UBA2103]